MDNLKKSIIRGFYVHDIYIENRVIRYMGNEVKFCKKGLLY